MTDKIAAFGTMLEMNGDDIAAVKSISGPGLSVDTEDVTTHDQTTAWEQVVATILRSGEITLDLVFDPAEVTHAGALAALVGKAAEAFVLKFPDTAQTAWEFDAFVTGFEPDAPVEGSLAASATLKLTGDVVLNSNWSA